MTLECIGQRAKEAEPILRIMTREEKDRVLLKAAELLVREQEKILAANEKDMQAGQERGMKPGLLDRLKLTKDRIAGMAEGLRQIADLPDPVGEVMKDWVPENGLHIRQVRVPLGVIGIIYEARPNVTADAFGLCFKTGNPVVLRGGSDAIHSNQAITEVLQKALAANGCPESSIQLLTDTSRETAAAFMKLNRYIDVLIPRGSAGLIATVVNNSTIPVIETGSGNCHIYVDEAADLEMAVNIVYNAKTQRIGVCNACESLVVNRKVKDAFLPLLAKRLQEKNVELRGDEAAREAVAMTPATEEDWGTEYLDYILSVKTVDTVEEAIAHINRYNTCLLYTSNTPESELCLKVLALAVFVMAVMGDTHDGVDDLLNDLGNSRRHHGSHALE